jgi:N-formylglutamate amidohydrolase
MTNLAVPPPTLRPGTGRWPILISVPHAGTDYPAGLLADARHGRASLEPLEDPLVDRLVWRAAELGIAVVVARAPRALIDCNRGPEELDNRLTGAAPGHDPGPRARGGLGLVPTRTPRHGELWRRPLGQAELSRRMAGAWLPFHDMVAAELAKLQARHGDVLLLDVHSMPARAPTMPQLVIGDRHGRSAAAWIGDNVRRTAAQADFQAAFNDPYAGGYVVERHGRPETGVHALQLEFDRGAYLAAGSRSPGSGFDRVAQLIRRLAQAAGEELLGRNALAQAAE